MENKITDPRKMLHDILLNKNEKNNNNNWENILWNPLIKNKPIRNQTINTNSITKVQTYIHST